MINHPINQRTNCFSIEGMNSTDPLTDVNQATDELVCGLCTRRYAIEFYTRGTVQLQIAYPKGIYVMDGSLDL